MQTTASAFAVNVQRLAKAIHAADYILLGAGARLIGCRQGLAMPMKPSFSSGIPTGPPAACTANTR